jgi:hypothetical protein
VTHNLALVLAQQGDMAGARTLFEKSLALSRTRGDTFGVLISLVDYASALANHIIPPFVRSQAVSWIVDWASQPRDM